MAGEWFRGVAPSGENARKIDTSVAHQARVYNYWLGGKDNFAADREAAEEMIAAHPGIAADARASRAFLGRAVRYLAGQAGIRQFLDIGTGIPAAGNTHEVAQAVTPAARVVYADNDPIVLAHARALLASGPEGATDYVDADIRDTQAILETAARTLDFTQPVALLLILILHVLPDSEAYGIVAGLLGSLPPGSYLAVSHPASDIRAEAMAEVASRFSRLVSGGGATLRTQAQVRRFFDGLELAEPGVVQPARWRPAPAEEFPAGDHAVWCAVGRKP